MLIKDKLTKLRESKGMSKEDFATKLGIDFGELESYESGEAEPSIAILNQICSIFEVDLSELTAPDEEPKDDVSLDEEKEEKTEETNTPSDDTKENEVIEVKPEEKKEEKKDIKVDKEKDDEVNPEVKKMRDNRAMGFIIGGIIGALFVALGIILLTSDTFISKDVATWLGIGLIVLGVGAFSIIELLFIKRGGWFIKLIQDTLLLNTKWPKVVFGIKLDNKFLAVIIKIIYAIFSFSLCIALSLLMLILGSIIAIILLPIFSIKFNKELKAKENKENEKSSDSNK